MNELKERFLDLSPRDQMMLVFGGLAVVIYILLFMVLAPMQKELASMENRNRAALGEQQRVHQLAGQVMASRENGDARGSANQNINSLLNTSLRQYGLTMENFQPSDNGARVRLASSEFNQVLAWLNEMENRHGLRVRDLTITADKEPGAVLVNVNLLQGG